MNVNDHVVVKTDGCEDRRGTILLIEEFNEGHYVLGFTA